MSPDVSVWPRAVYSTEQVREFDRRAMEEFGTPGFDLMQRAGCEALAVARERWPSMRSLVIYCGAGNNAGDGYVVAAEAVRSGLDVQVVAIVDPAKLKGDAAQAFGLAQSTGVAITESVTVPPGADLIVDALLGTGLARDVDGDFARAIAAINNSGLPILALDVPSGLDADDGSVHGLAVRADATITFVGLKAGLYLGSGPDCRGSLAFSGLGLPEAVFKNQKPVLSRLDPSDCKGFLRARSASSHKGLNGRLLVVGGASGFGGAARMAAEAALRAGAGLVHAAVAPASVAGVSAGRPEIMCRGVETAGELRDIAESMDVIVVGPGLGRDAWGHSMAGAVFEMDRPLVVDADGLNYLAGHRRRRDDWILTPHAGEAARLLESTASAVQSHRDRAVAALVETYGGVAVLKGVCSLVAEVTDPTVISVCDFGNPGMATGGTGDILAGLIGGLISQFGMSRPAAEIGVLVHSLAGDDAARDGGQRGMIASDLLPFIRRRVNPQE